MKMPKPMPVPMNTREYTWGIRFLLFQQIFMVTLLQLVMLLIYPQISLAGLNFIYYLLNFGIVVFIFRDFLEKSWEYACRHTWLILGVSIAGFILYWPTNIGLNLILYRYFPHYFSVNDAAITAISQSNMLLMGVGTVFLVPLAEELMFRGLVFGFLRRRSRLLAYVVSAIFFASIHVTGYIGQYEALHLLVCLLRYIPVSIILAGVYDISGSILAPVLIHTAINAIGTLLL